MPRNFMSSQKLLILHRANYKCLGCGTTLDATVFESDHKKAYAKGGATEAWNAQALCRKCNRHKSDKLQ
jgi:5-methylcytosine-specific restriction endonuclease McrA